MGRRKRVIETDKKNSIIKTPLLITKAEEKRGCIKKKCKRAPAVKKTNLIKNLPVPNVRKTITRSLKKAIKMADPDEVKIDLNLDQYFEVEPVASTSKAAAAKLAKAAAKPAKKKITRKSALNEAKNLVSDDSLSAWIFDDEANYESKVRISEEYQIADIPDLAMTDNSERQNLLHPALVVWTPTDKISDEVLDDYLLRAHADYGYNYEQGLGLLYWHKHDLALAESDLDKFIPQQYDWKREDHAMFRWWFSIYNDDFERIQTQMPHRAVSELIDHYYRVGIYHAHVTKGKRGKGGTAANKANDTQKKESTKKVGNTTRSTKKKSKNGK